MITNLRCFSFGFYTIHNIWSFFEQYISFWDRCLKFLIFQYWEWAFGFLSTIHFNKKLFSLFPSQILVCATVFATHYLFSFWNLHLLSSLNNKNKRVGRDIGTSLCKYQDHQDFNQSYKTSFKIYLQQSHIVFKISPTKIYVHT